MTERELQAAVIELAELLGYWVHHDRPARRSDGSWTTAIQGSPGFPDLVLAHPKARRPIFVELKSDRGTLDPDQMSWLTMLGPAAFVWNPRDWRSGQIERVLQAALRYDGSAPPPSGALPSAEPQKGAPLKRARGRIADHDQATEGA